MFKNKKNEKMKIAVSLPRLSYDNVLAEKLISATKFISKELMSFKKLSRLKLKINVRRTTLGTRTLGRVTHDSKFFAQKEFVIELHSNQSTSEMITTLAHELVHVSLRALNGHGDYDHEGPIKEGWTSEHTELIIDVNRAIEAFGL